MWWSWDNYSNREKNMINLELIEIKVSRTSDGIYAKEQTEVKAVSTSHSSLVSYCKNNFNETPLEVENYPKIISIRKNDTHYKIQQSNIVIVSESILN